MSALWTKKRRATIADAVPLSSIGEPVSVQQTADRLGIAYGERWDGELVTSQAGARQLVEARRAAEVERDAANARVAELSKEREAGAKKIFAETYEAAANKARKARQEWAYKVNKGEAGALSSGFAYISPRPFLDRQEDEQARGKAQKAHDDFLARWDKEHRP